jgi:hypothetical protein
MRQREGGGASGYLGLCVPGRGLGRALDVHAVAPRVVQLRQLYELEHLLVASGRKKIKVGLLVAVGDGE